jgi:hypothetical protein
MKQKPGPKSAAKVILHPGAAGPSASGERVDESKDGCCSMWSDYRSNIPKKSEINGCAFAGNSPPARRDRLFYFLIAWTNKRHAPLVRQGSAAQHHLFIRGKKSLSKTLPKARGAGMPAIRISNACANNIPINFRVLLWGSTRPRVNEITRIEPPARTADRAAQT